MAGLPWMPRVGWLAGEAKVAPGWVAWRQPLRSGRRTLPSRGSWPGCTPCRVERPGLAHAGLRGDVGPAVFEIDPGSVACLGFIPLTIVPEAVKVRRLRLSGPSQLPP